MIALTCNIGSSMAVLSLALSSLATPSGAKHKLFRKSAPAPPAITRAEVLALRTRRREVPVQL